LSEDEIKAVWKALDKEVSETSKSHRKRQATTAGSLKMRLLTAQRGGEVMSMEWSEIDGNWWTIPASKTKNGLTHRVPLSPFAFRILEEKRSLAEEPGKKKRSRARYV
jgi:integrase